MSVFFFFSFLSGIKCITVLWNMLTSLFYHRFGYFSPQWAWISSKGMADNGCVSQRECRINSSVLLFISPVIRLQANNTIFQQLLLYINFLQKGVKKKKENAYQQLLSFTLLPFSTNYITHHIHNYNYLQEQTSWF